MPRPTIADLYELQQQTLDQATRTNGRVTRLEEEVYGDDSHGTTGLVEIRNLVLDAKAVIAVLKWAVPILAMSNVGAVAALIYKALH